MPGEGGGGDLEAEGFSGKAMICHLVQCVHEYGRIFVAYRRKVAAILIQFVLPFAHPSVVLLHERCRPSNPLQIERWLVCPCNAQDP